MRGKRSCFHREAEPHRNIPAYAGKTLPYYVFAIVCEEHPRVCGENTGLTVGETYESGTSPRMRGKLLAVLHHHIENRNIPAYAGKTRKLN